MRTLIVFFCALLVGCGTAGGTDSADASSGESGSSSAGDPSTSTASTTTTTAGTTTTASTTSTTADTGESEAGSSESGPPPACDVAMPLPAGDYERTLEHGGVMRRYFLHVPVTEGSAPLVVNMHGYLSGAVMQSAWSQMNEATDPRGIITAHPEGLNNSWNAGSCCGESAANGVDDVGFIRAVVADIESAVCVDPQRIYATGLSNGGYLSNRLACEASDLFAAIAPVVAAFRIPECNPGRPVPVIAFNGVQDPLVPYADGVSTMDRWAEIDGCDPEPTVEEFEGGNCQTWTGCADGTSVEFCTLDPMGHCWPGGDSAYCFAFLGTHSDAIDATARILDFFAQHSLP